MVSTYIMLLSGSQPFFKKPLRGNHPNNYLSASNLVKSAANFKFQYALLDAGLDFQLSLPVLLVSYPISTG